MINLKQIFALSLVCAVASPASATQNPGWVLLERQTAAVSNTIDFTKYLDGTYKRYAFVLTDVIVVTNEAYFYMRFSTDGGSTWKLGASDYQWAIHGQREVAYSYDSQADLEISITPQTLAATFGNGTADGEALDAVIYVSLGSASIFPKAHYRVGYGSALNGLLISVSGAGQYNTSETINGVQFLVSNAHINSGEFSLYGIK